MQEQYRPPIPAYYNGLPQGAENIAPLKAKGYFQTLPHRFIEKIKPNEKTGCLEWTAGKLTKGYGQFCLDGKTVRAHRFAWEAVHGRIPKGMQVMHKCDNPACVNIDHLAIGKNRTNCIDAVLKGRHGSALISPETAAKIIVSKLSAKDTAKAFNVNTSLVRGIWAKRTWKTVMPGRKPRSELKYIKGRRCAELVPET